MAGSQAGHGGFGSGRGQHPVNFGHDFAKMEGLGQDLGLFGGAGGGVQGDRGEAGDKHDLEGGVHFHGALGQFDAVHAGHYNVSQQKVEGKAFDAFPGVAAIAEIGDGMAGLDQRRGKELAQRFIVFRQEDMRHACRPARLFPKTYPPKGKLWLRAKSAFGTRDLALGSRTGLVPLGPLGLSVGAVLRFCAMTPSDQGSGHQGGDAALALLFGEPFRIARPLRQSLPFIFASPHSGRIYPGSLVAASRLDALALRRSEDAFADELFGGVTGLGAPLITARFPRAYCDANRAPGELDPGMFSGPLGLAVDAPGARVLAGLGVIPRIVRDGAEIYRGKLAPQEAQARLAYLHRPYHAALMGLVEETLARFGVAIVIDCHSMPSALAVPDIVLGDRYGASAPPALTGWTENAFANAGFSIVRNSPYAGGYTTTLYGRGPVGCHALQIEINRSLYLEEDTMARRPAFETVQKRLLEALTKVTAIPLSAFNRRSGSMPLAAE